MKFPASPTSYSNQTAVEKLTEVINGDGRRLRILSSIEQQNMISWWTLYLCYEELKDGLQLSVCRYEVLGEYEDYFDETADDYVVPDEIDGKAVVGVEEYFVVGGNLELDEEHGVSEVCGNLTDEEAATFVNATPFDWDKILTKLT